MSTTFFRGPRIAAKRGGLIGQPKRIIPATNPDVNNFFRGPRIARKPRLVGMAWRARTPPRINGSAPTLAPIRAHTKGASITGVEPYREKLGAFHLNLQPDRRVRQFG